MNLSCHSNQINHILQTLKEAVVEGRDTLARLKEKLKASEILTGKYLTGCHSCGIVFRKGGNNRKTK